MLQAWPLVNITPLHAFYISRTSVAVAASNTSNLIQGNINDTILERSTRAIGLRTQIKSLISSISLGSFFFEISLIFRESMYLNSILVNCDSWYSISKKNMEILESADIAYFQVVFNSHSKTARESYYLETGKLKLKHMIAMRRLMFLQNILKRENSQVIKKMYLAQSFRPVKGDWYNTVKSDKENYGIQITDEEISDMSKAVFKKIIKEKVSKRADEELKSSEKSKVQNILKNLKLDKRGKIRAQEYLKTSKLSTIEKQMLFALRTHSYDVKSNYKSFHKDDMKCRICEDPMSYEDEIHTFQNCPALIEDEEKDRTIKFEDIFANIDHQVCAIKYFMKFINKRKLILELRG